MQGFSQLIVPLLLVGCLVQYGIDRRLFLLLLLLLKKKLFCYKTCTSVWKGDFTLKKLLNQNWYFQEIKDIKIQKRPTKKLIFFRCKNSSIQIDVTSSQSSRDIVPGNFQNSNHYTLLCKRVKKCLSC